mmetsp:Transcript_7309/g.18947  ORF Transcript_7309/g.18947 Transcript_7309/m.18947 type:complete len:223 (+) Transcript_7309:641-1309(+)
MVCHKRRLNERAFDEFLEARVEHVAGRRASLNQTAKRLALLARESRGNGLRVLHRAAILTTTKKVYASCLDHEVVHAHSAEWCGEGDARSLVLERVPCAKRRRAGKNHALRQLHHIPVVGERLVALHARELRVVASARALVAKHASKLEHTLDASNDETLEMQLRGNAKREVTSECVVVRQERPCVRTASAAVQHGRLHLQESSTFQERADCTRHLRARDER